MPGTYTLTSIEVLTDVNGKYSLKDDFILSISDKDVSHSFDIVKQNETLEEAVTDGSSEKKTFFVSAYDENNDLLKDTVMLFVTIVVIFVGYLIISRKRKKVEEIKRR